MAMKKIAIFITLLLVLSLSGCGSSGTNESTDLSAETESTQTESEDTPVKYNDDGTIDLVVAYNIANKLMNSTDLGLQSEYTDDAKKLEQAQEYKAEDDAFFNALMNEKNTVDNEYNEVRLQLIAAYTSIGNALSHFINYLQTGNQEEYQEYLNMVSNFNSNHTALKEAMDNAGIQTE